MIVIIKHKQWCSYYVSELKYSLLWYLFYCKYFYYDFFKHIQISVYIILEETALFTKTSRNFETKTFINETHKNIKLIFFRTFDWNGLSPRVHNPEKVSILFSFDLLGMLNNTHRCIILNISENVFTSPRNAYKNIFQSKYNSSKKHCKKIFNLGFLSRGSTFWIAGSAWNNFKVLDCSKLKLQLLKILKKNV